MMIDIYTNTIAIYTNTIARSDQCRRNDNATFAANLQYSPPPPHNPYKAVVMRPTSPQVVVPTVSCPSK